MPRLESDYMITSPKRITLSDKMLQRSVRRTPARRTTDVSRKVRRTINLDGGDLE